MIADELKNIAILNAKGVDYRYILWGISKNDAIDRLINSMLRDKGVLWKDFVVMLVVNLPRIRSNKKSLKKSIQKLVRRRKRQG